MPSLASLQLPQDTADSLKRVLTMVGEHYEIRHVELTDENGRPFAVLCNHHHFTELSKGEDS